MSALVEFLLVRIAEDEAAAREVGSHHRAGDSTHAAMQLGACDHAGQLDIMPVRVLAECAAKRAIVEAHPLTFDVVPVHTGRQPDVGCETCHTVTAASVMDPDYVEALGPCETLLALALPYKDHPQYRAEWAV